MQNLRNEGYLQARRVGLLVPKSINERIRERVLIPEPCSETGKEIEGSLEPRQVGPRTKI